MRDYWIPMVAFGVLTMAESWVPWDWFPVAYLAKAVIVSTALLLCRKPWNDIKVSAPVILPSVAIGIAVFAAWIGIEELIDYPRLGGRMAFDPGSLQGTAWWSVFVASRLFGLILMVPVMEEIFWRSFLLRFLTRQDFTELPVGTFSAFALWTMVAASAVAHPEWLAAVVASLAYALWLRRSRSLFGAIVSHATTNAALGGYVMVTGQFQYW